MFLTVRPVENVMVSAILIDSLAPVSGPPEKKSYPAPPSIVPLVA
jgi:hypothetical protein